MLPEYYFNTVNKRKITHKKIKEENNWYFGIWLWARTLVLSDLVICVIVFDIKINFKFFDYKDLYWPTQNIISSWLSYCPVMTFWPKKDNKECYPKIYQFSSHPLYMNSSLKDKKNTKNADQTWISSTPSTIPKLWQTKDYFHPPHLFKQSNTPTSEYHLNKTKSVPQYLFIPQTKITETINNKIKMTEMQINKQLED